MPARKPVTRRGASILLIAVVAVLAFVASHAVRSWIGKPEAVAHGAARRVIALSPSSVEIVYQLGLGDRLVGISRFCDYPPEASEKPVVGGYLDLDFEAVLALKPDCVILLDEQGELGAKLNRLGIRAISVDHSSIQGIIDSIQTIGGVFGKTAESEVLVSGLRARLDEVSKRSRHSGRRPRVLVSIDRDTTSDRPERVIAAGNKGVHQEFIALCGGVNAYQGPVAFPPLSRENLISLDPDIIIDLVNEEDWERLGQQFLLGQWEEFPELAAVRNKRITIVHDSKFMIPGPRFVDTLEVFSRIIHETP